MPRMTRALAAALYIMGCVFSYMVGWAHRADFDRPRLLYLSNCAAIGERHWRVFHPDEPDIAETYRRVKEQNTRMLLGDGAEETR